MLGWSKKCDGKSKIISAKAIAVDAQVVQAIDASSWPVLLKNVVYDDGDFFNGDGKVHIKQDGIYSISGQVYYETQPKQVGSRWALLQKNSSESLGDDSAIPSDSSASACASVSTIARLKEGDYLELWGGIGSRVGDTTATTIPERCQIAIAMLGD